LVTYHTHTRVSKDGVLTIRLPSELAESEVEVTVEAKPAHAPGDERSRKDLGWPPGFFEETAGHWQGEPLVREPQGDYEVRESID
jgi:hypothetical protein